MLESEIAHIMDPESLDTFVDSEKYRPLLEKYGKQKAAAILAKAFMLKLQDRLVEVGNGWAAEAIEDAREAFCRLVFRRYVRILEGVV